MKSLTLLILLAAVFNVIMTIYVIVNHHNSIPHYATLVAIYAFYLLLVKTARLYYQHK